MKKRTGSRKAAEWTPTPEQRIARKHKQLIELMDAYRATDDQVTRMEIQLEAQDLLHIIKTLETGTSS